jgi:hypothetical protein
LAYNVTDGGRLFRKYNSINLAWWHTMKYASMRIWSCFAQHFLAPWWHTMYPSGQFHTHMGKLPPVTGHLLLLHVSYPKFKEKLADAMNTINLAPRYLTYLQDLQFMCEFAIPTVPNTQF